MQTLLDPACHQRLVTRLRSLRADTPARWGRMNAPQMLNHLRDQLRWTLGEINITPQHGVLRWPVVRHAVMFWMPWPKGKIPSVPELFLTAPGSWDADLAALEELLRRFAAETGRRQWPEHVVFGPMSHALWGRFTHRHFDHHLQQFGA
jgi:hypothetical protein